MCVLVIFLHTPNQFRLICSKQNKLKRTIDCVIIFVHKYAVIRKLLLDITIHKRLFTAYAVYGSNETFSWFFGNQPAVSRSLRHPIKFGFTIFSIWNAAAHFKHFQTRFTMAHNQTVKTANPFYYLLSVLSCQTLRLNISMQHYIWVKSLIST